MGGFFGTISTLLQQLKIKRFNKYILWTYSQIMDISIMGNTILAFGLFTACLCRFKWMKWTLFQLQFTRKQQYKAHLYANEGITPIDKRKFVMCDMGKKKLNVSN